MKCVNRNHKDFKFLAEYNDVSLDLLELITHKYWLETGSEDNFPSTMYIQGQLGKGQYEEHNNNVINLWEKNYSQSQEFTSKNEAEAAYSNALRFFPSSAVVLHKNFVNNYILTVKKPVNNVKITVQDIIGRETKDAQELADFKLINSEQGNSAYEQFAIEQSPTALMQWEKDVLPEILTHMENMLLPIKYRADMEKFFKEHPNSFIQQVISQQKTLTTIDNKKLSNALNTIDSAIKTGDWTDEALEELENLNIKDYGTILKRFSQEELRSSNEALRQAEAIVTRGNGSSDRSNPQANNRSRAEEQEYQIENWAKENGLWYNNYQESKDGSLEAVIEADGGMFSSMSGSESMIYWTRNGVVKAIDASHYNDVRGLLDKIALHNSLFPETALELVGFGRDRGNSFRAVVKQKFVEGIAPSVEDITSFAEKIGLTKKQGWYYTNDGKRITDLNPKNVIKGLDGTMFVIDCDIEFAQEQLTNREDQETEQFFTTPNGEVYGFVDKDGNIYLDETIISPEHPVHEYTHLWDRIVAKKNPELWKRGINLLKKTSLWEEIANNENYGLKWKAEEEMTDDKFNSLMASEIHARLVGKEGSRLLEEEAKKKGAKGIIGRLRTWLLDMFKNLKATFSNWSDEELNKLTLDDFVNMTVRDFFTGVNFREKGRQIQFTFRDGTTIPISFVPNYQQVAALNAMSDFLNSDATTMTLSGYAGTGKTTLMEIIAQKAKKQHKPIIFSATTNKATAVLKARVAKAGFDAQTLNKVFGINVEVDSSKAYNARNLVNVLKDINIEPGTTVVIDEASMINEENYGILNRIASENGLKIIYVGDKAQLAPVNETQVSKVFRNSEGRVVELTQVERTDDNAILKEATNIRNGIPLSGVSEFNEKGEGVGYLTPKNRDEIGKVIRQYIQGLKDNPNFFRILVYTNKAVTAYNDFVRSLLGYTDPIPHVGEPLTGYANWGYEWKTKSYRFINSESYRVTRVGHPQTSSISINGENYTMQYVPITMENSLGESDTFNYMDIKGNQENRKAAIQLANQKKALWEQYRHAVGREAKSNILAQINSIDQFLFVNDNIEDPTTHNLLQPKTVDFGYALTIHKSQGSTFTHVLMDDIDVAKASNTQNNAANAENVYIGVDQWGASMDNMQGKAEEVDMGITEYDLNPAKYANPTITTDNANIANVRQQLEYVGVSRATNTVTIVSNNVKKEGSPLNHSLKEKPSETINQQESRSNKETEVISATVAPYLNTSYEDYMAMTPERQMKMREAFSKAAHEVAEALGVTLDMKQASFNIGGYQFEDGGSVVEPSFTFRLDTTPEKARLFAALMGDLGYEQQEAVVSNYKVEDYDSADGVKYYIKYSNSKALLPLLDKYGIKNFTYDKTRGELSVLSFDSEDLKKFDKLVEDLNKIENGEKYDIQTEAFKSSYDAKGNRRDLYETWDSLLRKEQGREGYNSQLHSLVQEALRKLQDSTLPLDNGTTEAPQKIPLVNYEYMMDFTEDTTVDAAWKIPLLEQLDKQLGLVIEQDSQLENPDYTEQNEILDRMTRILEAKNQEDLLDLQSEEPKTKKTVEQNLTEFEKMTQQINNLLDSNIISASEIRHVAELVVNSISDTITILQKEEGAAEKFFPNIQTDIDFKTASRKDIVEAIGINNLIHRAKLQFDPEQNDYEDFDTIEQADLIIDNWDAIMTLASDTFAMTEGFGIMHNYDKGGFATTQNSTVDFDNFNDYSNDPDAMAESEKDEQEHWQVEQRTIDVLNSMSQMVRLALHECYQMDKEGNKVMSKWGIAERINPRQAVNSILRWTQGSLTLKDMIGKMQGKATQNPWLNQLIERLSDKSGKETDFQSQFFGVFSKHFQPYSVVLLEDGKYHSIPVNSHPALSEAMQTITTQFKIGEHPLFTDKGINRKLLGSDSTTDAKSPFNLHQALTALNTIQDRLQHGEQLDNAMSKEAAANIMGVCKVMGYPVTEEMLSDVINEENLFKMTNSLRFIVQHLDAAREEQFRNAGTSNANVYNPFAFNSDNGIAGTLRNFLTPITDTLEDTAVSAFYDSGKMYQSYVTPSFMTKLMNKFRLEGQEFEDFIMQEYGATEWFKSAKNQWDINKGWRNEWLRLLATDENARKVFDHKVELNFNKHNYMRNMSDAEYALSLITEYFAETGQKKEALVPAWFRVPIMSNKPSSEFIKFYSYRGANYKDEIIYGLHQMFNQELSRIQTVHMRNHSKGDADFIANFDTNGRKFNFLPFLNKYLEANETSDLGLLLKKKIEGTKALTSEEEARLSTLIDQTIRQDMENRVATILIQWENSGVIEAAKNIEGIGTEEAQIRANLENFLWNDNFASKNILQLTVTDIAFYKDAEDLQKRLAQIHAPGIRGNVTATDYNGNRVSDGKYRTILIQGLQKFKTDLIANIAEVFDRKIAAAPEEQKAQLRALKESLVGENGRYTKIDVTDGQAYSSPSSYRKKAFIFGKWSKQAEDIYQKLLKGDYNYTDLEVAFQPLKPFVYTHLQKDMGVENAPIHQMPIPFQAKNSEYLLIMADALLQGEQTSKPNILRAIYRVMEDSERLNPTKGIDTVQFDSAIKSGLQAPIDLNPFLDMDGGEEAAFEYMKRVIYKLDDQGNPSNEYATDTYVHEGLYEDYCLQQEVPEHFKNHSQAHGSQIRMIIPSDLDFYKNPNADHNDPDNQVFYEWTEPDGTKKKLRADEFRHEYEQTIADNIRESIDQLSQELYINSEDKKERNIALSKILQREILSSPRYGIDLIQACSVDKETGEFRIPKGDPIQAKRIEQLINSIIKNRVNKQKIAGGPIVQVTNFGTSRQLHIRFNDKNGGLLMTREEYEQNPQKKEMSQTDKFNARYGRKPATGNMSYEEYVKQNQAGIAYFEVFIPIWANEIFEKFSNEDGSINMEALEATDPELLKMISYRIPTEDKYSCAPMKAVGFMPREAGDAIMFPYELTEIDDSDFDVDKRYVMRKDIPIIRKPKHIIRKELFDIVDESYKKQHDGKELPANIADEVEVFLDSPDTMRSKSTFTKWLYNQYQKVAYTTEAPTSGRKYRDNKIVDMTWAVLTNEMTADKILNPGGFDVFKRAGYMVAAYKNPANNYSWEQLQQMSIDELNKLSYTDKDLTWLDTQIQFYKQNAAAASLIGVFAVNKVAHATLESNDYYVAVDEICGNEPFTIADTEFGGRMKVDSSHDSEGNLIGKTIGAGVSASADAAKTPVLNLMNINMTTAGIFNTLLRLGMSPNDASLFMSQEVIERILNEFNRENLTNYKPLSTIIEEHIDNLRDKHSIDDGSNINTEPLSREELIEGLTSEDHEVIDYKVLTAFQKIRSLVDAMRKPTFATRFNSVSSAVGPLIIDNLITEYKMEHFTDAASEDGTHFYDSKGIPVDIDDIFYDHPILREFARTVDIAKVMFNDMPAGSTGFRELLATLPEGLTDKVYNDKKLLDNLSNFYQSYLLIASRMVNPANLKKFIDDFPKYFNDQKFREKYADNALISAIRMNVSKRTGRAFLSINITGIDESQKEVYRSAWIDLHKDNPELSRQLFEYCFFRAGVGFSPKTFMSLVPVYVKERLSTDLGNGSQATYVDTYRMFPRVNPNVVIDQWVRNNWDNNKLVPKKGGEGTHYIVDLKRGTLVARDPKDMADLKGNTYIKTRHNGQTYLWKQVIADKTAVNYVMVKPLGNNAEYLEMSLSDITKPMSETKETIEDMQESELQTTSPVEAEAAETSTTDNTTHSEKAKQVAELADLIQKQNPKFNKTQARNQIERMKEKPDLYAGFLVNVYKQKGLNLTKEEALAEFKKLC